MTTVNTMISDLVGRIDFLDEKIAELVNDKLAISASIRDMRAERVQLDRMLRATKPRAKNDG